MLIDEEQKQKMIILLQDIQDWMLSNDYECGNVGSQLYDEIGEMINILNPTLKK